MSRKIAGVLLVVAFACPRSGMPSSSSIAGAQDQSTPNLKRLQDRDRHWEEAKVLRIKEKLAESAQAAEKALAIEREVLGSSHEKVVGTLVWLGEVYQEREDFAAARKALEEALAATTKLRGEMHWQTTDIRLALAHLDRVAQLGADERRRLTEAEAWTRKADQLRTQDANAVGFHNQLEDGVAIAERSVDVNKLLLGQKDLGYLRSLKSLARLYLEFNALQFNDQAGPVVRRAQQAEKELLGPEHPRYVASLDRLIEFSRYRGNDDAFKSVREEAFEAKLRLLKEEQADYLPTLFQLLEFYLDGPEYARAEPLVNRIAAACVREMSKGSTEASAAWSRLETLLVNAAERNRDKGNYTSARKAIQEAIAVVTRVSGEDFWQLPSYRLLLTHIELLETKKRFGAHHPDYVAGLSRLADQYRQQYYWAAEPFYREALELKKELRQDDSLESANLLDGLGAVYQRQAEGPQQSLRFARQWAAMKPRAGLPASEKQAEMAAAAAKEDYDSAIERFTKAQAAYRQALAIRQKLLGEAHVASYASLSNLASVSEQIAATADDQGEYRMAGEARREVLAIRSKLPGTKKWQLTDARLALAYVERLVSLDPETVKRLREADTLHAEPISFATFFNLGPSTRTKAVEGADKELAIRKELLGEEHFLYAASLHKRGAIYLEMREPDPAEPFLRRALEIRLKLLGEVHPDSAETMSKLGELYTAKRENDRAEPLLLRSTEITKELYGEDHVNYAKSQETLAGHYLRVKNYAKAAQSCEIVARVHEKQMQAIGAAERPAGRSGNWISDSKYANALQNLAMAYLADKRPEQAFAVVDRAMRVHRDQLRGLAAAGSDQEMMEVSKSSLLMAYNVLINMAADDTSKCPQGMKLALDWTLWNKTLVFDTLSICREGRRLAADDRMFIERVEGSRRLRQRLSNLSLSPPQGLTEEQLGRQTERLRIEIRELETEINKSIGKRHPELFQDFDKVDSTRLQLLLPADSALVEVLRVHKIDLRDRVLAGEAFRPITPSRYLAFVVVPGEVVPRLVDLGAADVIERAIGELRDQVASVPRENRFQEESSLEAEYRKSAAALYRLVFAPLRPALGQATLIYFSPEAELNGVAFEALVDDGGKYLVETYRFAYLSGGRDLLRPAPPPSRSTVVFAGPDYDLKAAERVAKRKTPPAGLARVPGGLMRGAPIPELRGLRWRPLPGAAAEAEYVQRALQETVFGPVRMYRGADAVEEAFKLMAAPRVLHVATHGFFLPDKLTTIEDYKSVEEFLKVGQFQLEALKGMHSRIPSPSQGTGRTGAAPRPMSGIAQLKTVSNPLLRSGIVLAGANTIGEEAPEGMDDGWVTADEIAAMDLRGTELVVLSACETGRGDVRVGQPGLGGTKSPIGQYGEGVYGLRRAFMFAGARTLVSSLYKVPDEQTLELMQSFYGSLKAGNGKLAALHEAQLKMLQQRRKQNGAAHPFYWASFILVGDPN